MNDQAKKYVKDDEVLLTFWNHSKNDTFCNPESTALHSNKKIWWRCPDCKNEWEDSPDKMSRKDKKCPYCSHRRLLQGFNDLKTLRPELVQDWDRKLNGNLKPEQFTLISGQKIHWTCHTCRHQWVATIKSRAIDSSGCPICAKNKVWNKRRQEKLKNQGGLTDPELLSDWDYKKNSPLAPEQVTYGSNKKVWWKCHICGYEWKTTINNRTGKKHHTGCPACSGRALYPGHNDLQTLKPELAKEWDDEKNSPIKPSDVMPHSAKKYWWICPRGHHYQANPLHRSQGTGCPICNSGRQTSFAEQAIYYYVKKIFPDAINRYKDIFDNGMELDIYIPELKLAIEYDGMFWHGKKGSRDKERRKYQICSQNGIKLYRIKEESVTDWMGTMDWGISLPKNESDSIALDHTITVLLSKIDPECNMWTRKDPLHVWSDVDVNTQRDRFEILSYLKGPVKNSLAEVSPDLVKEWDYENNKDLKPETVSAGSSWKVHWICKKCGYHWEAAVSKRVREGTGCPKCAGQVFETGVNDLCTKNPEVLKDWDYKKNDAERLFPNKIPYNSSIRAHWKCSKCGHEWESPIRSVTVSHQGCIQCGYQAAVKTKAEKNFDKVGPITDSLLLKEWDDEANGELKPQDIAKNSHKRVHWVCSKCGHKWVAPVYRRSLGSGCRKCADKNNPELLRKACIRKGRGIADPLLLKEWNVEENQGKKPEDYSTGSNEKIIWKCSKCGYHWEATINSRVQGSGCPRCNGSVPTTGVNDFATCYSEIAKEWDYEKNNKKPEEVSSHASIKYWWVCPECHKSYLASPAHRAEGTGCPKCARKRIGAASKKPVNQYDLNGNFIRTFDSVREAAKAMHCSSSAISQAIRKTRPALGFVWKHKIKEG